MSRHDPVFAVILLTGMMCVVYRVIVQGWSKDDAIEEMTDNGYGERSYQFQNTF